MAGSVIKMGNLGKAAAALGKQPSPAPTPAAPAPSPGGQSNGLPAGYTVNSGGYLVGPDGTPVGPGNLPPGYTVDGSGNLVQNGKIVTSNGNQPVNIQAVSGTGGSNAGGAGTAGAGYNIGFPYGDPGTAGHMASGETRAMLGGGLAGANEISGYELGWGDQQRLWDEQQGQNAAQNLGQLGANYAQGMGQLSNQYSRLGNELGATGMAFAGMGNPFAQNAGVGSLGGAGGGGGLPPSPWQNPGAYTGGASAPANPTSNQAPAAAGVTKPIFAADLDLAGHRTYGDMQVGGGAQNAATQQQFSGSMPVGGYGAAGGTTSGATQRATAPAAGGYTNPGAYTGGASAPTAPTAPTAPAAPAAGAYQNPGAYTGGATAANGPGQGTSNQAPPAAGNTNPVGFAPAPGTAPAAPNTSGVTSPVPAWMQIAQNGGGAYNFGANQAQANLGQEQAALGNLQSAAAGNQPSAAALQMQQGTDQSIAAQMAMANSTRGSLGLANAQRNAQQQGAAMQQANVQNTGILRAQEMQQARQAYMQGTQALGQQAISQQQVGQNAQLAAMQGATGAQEFGLNYAQQGELAGLGGALGAYGQAAQTQIGATQGGQGQQLQYEGLGQNAAIEGQNLALNAQQNQVQAEIANEQTAAGLAAGQAQTTQNYVGAGLSAAGAIGAAALAADADLVEPGGGAHWTLREEPGFLLAKDQVSGEMGKVHLDPLSEKERHMAQGPHGAGPLGANDPRRQRTPFYSDMQLQYPGGLGAAAL